MSNKIEKIIEQDINNNYKVEYNKEELYKNFIPKTNNKKTIYITKLKLTFSLLIVCIVGLVLGCTISYIGHYKNNNSDIITDEFREFVSGYGQDVNDIDLYYYLCVDNRCNLYIYKKTKQDNNEKEILYFYYAKFSKDPIKVKLHINNNGTILNENPYGLLAKNKLETSMQEINFSIEIDGKIKQFILN